MSQTLLSSCFKTTITVWGTYEETDRLLESKFLATQPRTLIWTPAIAADICFKGFPLVTKRYATALASRRPLGQKSEHSRYLTSVFSGKCNLQLKSQLKLQDIIVR